MATKTKTRKTFRVEAVDLEGRGYARPRFQTIEAVDSSEAEWRVLETVGPGFEFITVELGGDTTAAPLEGADELLTIPEVQSILGVSRSAVYRLLAKGELAKTAISGRSTRIRRSDLALFVARTRE